MRFLIRSNAVFACGVLLLLMSNVTVRAQSGHPQLRRMTRIEQITPNPFNPSTGVTEIRFVLVMAGEVEVTIFSIDGKEIATLVHDEFIAGSHSVTWDGHAADGTIVSNGAYLCRLRQDKYVTSSTLVIA